MAEWKRRRDDAETEDRLKEDFVVVNVPYGRENYSTSINSQSAVLPIGWKYRPNNCIGAWLAWFNDDVRDKKSKLQLEKTAIVIRELIAATGLTEDEIAAMDNPTSKKTFHTAFLQLHPAKDPGMHVIALFASRSDSSPASVPTCMKLWSLWFRAPRKPWCFRGVHELPLEMQAEHSQYVLLMNKLRQIALDMGLIESKDTIKLNEAPFKALFSLVFDSFTSQCGPSCTLTPESVCSEAVAWSQVDLDVAFRLEGAVFPVSLDAYDVASVVLGHGLTHGSPFSLVEQWHEASMDYRSKTKLGIDVLVQIAVDHNVVESIQFLEAIQDEGKIMDVFDRSFAILKDQLLDHVKPRIYPHLLSHSVFHAMNPNAWIRSTTENESSKKKKKPKSEPSQ
ncbi:hypothetical protein Ae201684P_005814 [Aphanomyces euteiches]|nr:hypothetical protein Ae201684P_005814 [Aphanomyces euteiches]